MAEALPFAAVGGGVASGLGSYFGGQAQANAYKQAANQANQRWNQAYGEAQPFIQGGQNALNTYNTGMGLSGSAAQSAWANGLSSNPAFQASTNYGLNQIQARDAAQGLGMSGGEAAALHDFSQKNLLGFQQQTLDNLFREESMGANLSGRAMASSTGASSSTGGFMGNAGASTGNSYAALGNAGLGISGGLASYYYGTGSGTRG